LGILTGAGDYASKEAAGGGWTQPFYYYGYTMLRDLLSVFPIICLSLLNLWRFKNDLKFSNFFIGVFGVLLGVIPLSLSGTKEPLYILACYFSLIIISLKLFAIEVRKNDLVRIFVINFIFYIIFFYLAFFTQKSKTLDGQFMAFSLAANILVYLLIYFKNILNKKLPIVLTLLIFSIAPLYNYLNTENRFKAVINFIEQDNSSSTTKASDTYIVSDYYSHVGYFVWNRV